MLTDKKISPAITELIIRCRKLNTFLAFITQSYFAVPKKKIRLNSTHYFIMKTPKKRELQQIEFNNSSGIDIKNLMNLYKKCSEKSYSSLVIHSLKSVQILSFVWSIFSCTWTEYGDLLHKSLNSIQVQKKTDQKKLCIWTPFAE